MGRALTTNKKKIKKPKNKSNKKKYAPKEITEKFTKNGFLLPEIDQREFTNEINKIRNKGILEITETINYLYTN